MSKTENIKALPAYRIFSVLNDGSEKGVWQEIGAAWHNKDQKGLNLYFKALALPGAQIVLREPKMKDTPQPKGKGSRRALGNYDELNQVHGDGAQ